MKIRRMKIRRIRFENHHLKAPWLSDYGAEGCGFESGLRQPAARKLCVSLAINCYLFQIGRIGQQKERNGPRLSYAVSKIQSRAA